MRKVHMVSVGLEYKRVKSYLSQEGASKVILIYFYYGNREEESAEDILLRKNRKKLTKYLKENGIEVKEKKIEILKPLNHLCSELYNLVIKNKEEGSEIILGIGTGHTTFKIVCYIIGCIDSDVKVKYFQTKGYLETLVFHYVEKYKKILEKRDDTELLNEFLDEFQTIANFAEDGGSDITDEIIDITPIPIPTLDETEFEILKFIMGRSGRLHRIKDLSEYIYKNEPSWFELPKNSLRKGKKEVSYEGKIRAITNSLSRGVLKRIELKGYIKMVKTGQRTEVSFSPQGKLIWDMLAIKHNGKS